MTSPILMTKNANIFKKAFCTLTDKLHANLPPLSLRFGLNSVRQCYKKILKYPKSKFKFNVVSEETELKLLQVWMKIKLRVWIIYLAIL